MCELIDELSIDDDDITCRVDKIYNGQNIDTKNITRMQRYIIYQNSKIVSVRVAKKIFYKIQQQSNKATYHLCSIIFSSSFSVIYVYESAQSNIESDFKEYFEDSGQAHDTNYDTKGRFNLRFRNGRLQFILNKKKLVKIFIVIIFLKIKDTLVYDIFDFF